MQKQSPNFWYSIVFDSGWPRRRTQQQTTRQTMGKTSTTGLTGNASRGYSSMHKQSTILSLSQGTKIFIDFSRKVLVHPPNKRPFLASFKRIVLNQIAGTASVSTSSGELLKLLVPLRTDLKTNVDTTFL